MNQENSIVQYQGVNVKTDGKLVIIQLNVPKRKNALTPAMVKKKIQIVWTPCVKLNFDLNLFTTWYVQNLKLKYAGIKNALKEASKNPNISIVAITGTGDFYSSGNDFGVLMGKLSESSPTETEALKGVIMVQ